MRQVISLCLLLLLASVHAAPRLLTDQESGSSDIDCALSGQVRELIAQSGGFGGITACSCSMTAPALENDRWSNEGPETTAIAGHGNACLSSFAEARKRREAENAALKKGLEILTSDHARALTETAEAPRNLAEAERGEGLSGVKKALVILRDYYNKASTETVEVNRNLAEGGEEGLPRLRKAIEILRDYYNQASTETAEATRNLAEHSKAEIAGLKQALTVLENEVARALTETAETPQNLLRRD